MSVQNVTNRGFSVRSPGNFVYANPHDFSNRDSDSHIRHKNGLTAISTSNKDDVIQLKYHPDGSATVTVNGKETRLSPVLAKNIKINGMDGDDLISVSGEPPADTKLHLKGGDGNDIIYGGSGDEIIDGGRGHDKMYGGDGDDKMRGGWGSFNDTIYGQGGDDTINGGNGDDIVRGGDGNDWVSGDNGNDKVFGDAGKDHVFGGNDDDVLFGGADVDYLDGGRGSDHEFQDPINETPGCRPETASAEPETAPSRPIKPPYPYPIIETPFPEPEHPCCCHNHYHDVRPTYRSND